MNLPRISGRRLFAALLPMAAVLAAAVLPLAAQTPAPKLVKQDGRYALMVDGQPFLVLGAQIGNSAAWPALLDSKVWPALEAMHVNTAEAPVYWEQMEPRPGQFDWTNVDALISGARQHHMHLVLLWFGTWKNGNNHYVPQWVKRDPVRFPRMLNSAGAPIDDMSANSDANMEADRSAFTALMHHLAEKDSAEHTILMIQVENESGGIGAARDYSAQSNREFAGQVPAALVKALGRKPGTWSEVFAGYADESFQAWHQARYVNAIAEAGKREFNIPYYCNVWLAYPPGELPERHIPTAGIGYPSGGPNQRMLPIWKAVAKSIDVIGPDVYSSDAGFYQDVLDVYSRPDNALWIPETGEGDDYAPYFFAALGKGAIGFSPFGIDWSDHHPVGSVPRAHAANYALVGEMDRTLARLNFEGRLKGFVEAAGGVEQQQLMTDGKPLRQGIRAADVLTDPVTLANALAPLDEAGNAETRAADAAGAWVAEVRFGFPQHDGARAPGTGGHSGRALVAQLGPDEFLLTGLGAAIFFHRPGYLPGIRMQILSAEEGYYTPSPNAGGADEWHTIRTLNGDETDRGIQFPDPDAERAGARRAPATGGAEPATPQQGPKAVRVVIGRF